MKTVADIAKLEFHHRQGGQFRWITITTLMLAIGTILHLSLIHISEPTRPY